MTIETRATDVHCLPTTSEVNPVVVPNYKGPNKRIRPLRSQPGACTNTSKDERVLALRKGHYNTHEQSESLQDGQTCYIHPQCPSTTPSLYRPLGRTNNGEYAG